MMTWDFARNFIDNFDCRNNNCNTPFFSGDIEPEVITHAGKCELKKGEVWVKQIIYHAFDNKTPKFIARSCGRGLVTNDGSHTSTSCYVDREGRDGIVEVCFSNDGDNCNAAPVFNTSASLVTLSIMLFFFTPLVN